MGKKLITNTVGHQHYVLAMRKWLFRFQHHSWAISTAASTSVLHSEDVGSTPSLPTKRKERVYEDINNDGFSQGQPC